MQQLTQQSRKIDANEQPDREFEFSICTLVTCFSEYEQMMKSAIEKGFNSELCEYLHVDNTNKNNLDAYSAINLFLTLSNSKYTIICHQDVLFQFDNIEHLKNQIAFIEGEDTNWAILGNAGICHSLKPHMLLSDNSGKVLHSAKNSNTFQRTLALALDENFMVFNNRLNLSTTNSLTGFHLYGFDLCNNASHLGYKCYVINFHLMHKSSGNKDRSFFKSKRRMKALMNSRKKGQLIKTTSTQFYSSCNSIINFLANSKYIIVLLIKLRKQQ